MKKLNSKDALQFSNQLKRYRRRAHLKLYELSRLMGVKNSGHVCEYERSKKLPNLVNALHLSAALNCPLEVLYSELFQAIRQDISKRKEEFGNIRKRE